MGRRTVGPSLTMLALLVSACQDRAPLSPGDTAAPAAQSASNCEFGVSDELALSELEALRERIDALPAGTLNQGQRRALHNHLDNAALHLPQQRYCPARAQLEAFRRQVESFRAIGLLRDRQMAPLLERTRLILRPLLPPGTETGLHGPHMLGELRTGSFEGEPFTYEVLDGLAIYQTDMILGYADEFEEWLAGGARAAGDGEIGTMSGACIFHHFSCERWTNGVVGYDYAFDWGADNGQMFLLIEAAIGRWERDTGMTFERRTSGERLVFRNSDRCSSHVGRKVFTGAEPQWVNLNNMGCGANLGIIIHEIAHAVGLYHEQSRNDRDDFVRINFDQIASGQAHNFDRYGNKATDVGPYDPGSIMHYSCGLFRRVGATGNTLDPIAPGLSCSDLGQLDDLSEGDILGAYWLYRPVFEITGAGGTRDRFDLGLDFTRHVVRNPAHIVWRSNRVPDVLGTGLTLRISTPALPSGPHVITVSVEILGVTLAQRSTTVSLFNNPPVVTLGPDRDVVLHRRAFVTATVTDVEDGSCAPGVCSFAWDPTPESASGATATYRFRNLGPHTVSVMVQDGGGATGSASMTLEVIKVPPVPVIVVPVSGASYSAGASVALSGYATDLSVGPDPGPGMLHCSALAWASDNASDRFSSTRGCSPTLTLGDPGTRTLTLTATDSYSLSASTAVQVTVGDCGSNCPPDVSFVITTPPELIGSIYDPPFTGPGYFLRTQLQLTGTIADADLPPDNPVQYEWRLTRPCFDFGGGGCPPDLVLGSGSVVVPEGPGTATVGLTWTPESVVPDWPGCTGTALPHTLRLWTRDARGATNTFSRTVHFACDIG